MILYAIVISFMMIGHSDVGVTKVLNCQTKACVDVILDQIHESCCISRVRVFDQIKYPYAPIGPETTVWPPIIDLHIS